MGFLVADGAGGRRAAGLAKSARGGGKQQRADSPDDSVGALAHDLLEVVAVIDDEVLAGHFVGSLCHCGRAWDGDSRRRAVAVKERGCRSGAGPGRQGQRREAKADEAGCECGEADERG